MHPIARAVFLLGLALVATADAAPADTRPQRPNIILIMADDMGFSDLGCYGSEIATPNLDRLAEGGIRFTHFYNAARCCPTRAALLTGLYPHQTGVGAMVGDFGLPAYRGFLNDRCVTIAEVLRAAGYRTMMAGKWHVGEQRPHWPVDRGFEHYYGIISGGANYFDITKTKAPNVTRIMARDDQPFVPTPGTFYITDAFSDNAVRMLKETAGDDRPFFLYLAYTAPHWPLHAWPEDIAKYQSTYTQGWDALRQQRYQRMLTLGLIRPEWALTPRDETAPAWADVTNKEQMDRRMAVYAAQIDRMDQGIGRVLKTVRDIGAHENTLVMFLSDNGGCAEGGPLGFDRRNNGVPCGGVDSYMSYGLSWANASNTPFRRYKHWTHEGGISTPLIAYWPAVIQDRGKLTHQVGHIVDLMATCADVGQAAYPETFRDQSITPLEGKSLLPIFQGKQRQGHDVLYWEHEGNRAVRQGKWKLVSAYPRNWELYDLEADRTELHNLAAEHPDKVREMANLYKAWAARCGVMDPQELRAARKPAKKPAAR